MMFESRCVVGRVRGSVLKLMVADADGQVTDKTRQIGLVVVRGTTITLIAPADGSKEIANPFTQQD